MFGVSGAAEWDCKIQTRHCEIINDSSHKDVTFSSSCCMVHLIAYRKKMHCGTWKQVVAWNMTHSNKIWLIQKQSTLFCNNEPKKKSIGYFQLNKVSTSTGKKFTEGYLNCEERIITSVEGNGSNFHETWSRSFTKLSQAMSNFGKHKVLKDKCGQILIQYMCKELATAFIPKQFASNNQRLLIMSNGGLW